MIDTYIYADGGDRNRVGWKALRVVLYTAREVRRGERCGSKR